MDDKTLKHAESMNASACKKQGGAVRGQGPKGMGKAKIGEKISSRHSKHEAGLHKQGGKTLGIQPIHTKAGFS